VGGLIHRVPRKIRLINLAWNSGLNTSLRDGPQHVLHWHFRNIGAQYVAADAGILARVENRRSGGSLPVAMVWRSFRIAASVRFGLALFPVPAHRTGQAVLPHPALGKDSRFRPRKTAGPRG
jgi:hypothetical protein